MKRNVLLIVLPYLVNPKVLVASKRVKSFKAFPYGVLSMATYVEKNVSYEVKIEVLDCNVYDEDFVTLIKNKLIKFKPDLVGLSMSYDVSYKYLKEAVDTIKTYSSESVLVLGGSVSTSAYDIILNEHDNIDGICYYEGELPLLRLVNSKHMIHLLETDASWITKKSLINGRIPQKLSIVNLDEVINLDYSFVDISKYNMTEAFSPFAYKREKGKQFFLITSRGCPYSCAFCMRSADNDKSMRYASVEEIIKHVRYLVEKNDMKILTIYDDQILLNRERVKRLFKELAQFNLRIECPNGVSVAFIDDEIAKLMRKAGMDTIQIAIESGSPYVLNKIIHKPLNLKRVKPVIKILRKYGFWIQGFFVSGMPGETDEHRDETVRFIKDIGIDWASFSLAIPTRGSELFRTCVENGYIKNDSQIGGLHSNKFIINTPEYSADYVIEKTYLMYLDVNFVNNYRMRNGEWRIVLSGLRSVIKRQPDHAFAYYYLARALFNLNEIVEAQFAIDKFHEIIEKDNKWKKYAEYFKVR